MVVLQAAATITIPNLACEGYGAARVKGILSLAPSSVH